MAKITDTFKCTSCGQKCYNSDTIYPTLVFSDEENKICEDCSIDYEEVNGKVQYREDLIQKGYILKGFNNINIIKKLSEYTTKIEIIIDDINLSDIEKLSLIENLIKDSKEISL